MASGLITIMDEVELRLANITIANGYNTTLNLIERARLTPFQPGDWPAVTFWPGDGNIINNNYGGDQVTTNLVIAAFDSAREEVYADVAAKLYADVMIALNRTSTAPLVTDTPSYQLGNLVSLFKCEEFTYIIGEGNTPYCGIIMDYQVTYQAIMGDPINIEI